MLKYTLGVVIQFEPSLSSSVYIPSNKYSELVIVARQHAWGDWLNQALMNPGIAVVALAITTDMAAVARGNHACHEKSGSLWAVNKVASNFFAGSSICRINSFLAFS